MLLAEEPEGTGRERSRSRADQVFAFGCAVLALHVPLAAGVVWLPASAALALAAAVVFGRAPRGLRVGLCALLGTAGLADGLAIHAAHAALHGPRVADITGILAALSGAALVAVAYAEALRGRGWGARAIALLVTLAVMQWVAIPLLTAGMVVNADRPAVAGAGSLGLPGARDVRVAAGDGTRLAGWLVPGRNGAGVVLLHGSHGTRASTTDHLRLLSGAGFAVLAIDARGHGESAGETNAAGWTGADDVAGAVGFLRRRPGVDPSRVAALGLSMGGEAALRAAAQGVPLGAVVADGAGASTLGDQRLDSSSPVTTSVTWASMRAIELLGGEGEPPALKDVVHRLRAPALLVASNAPGEQRIDRALTARIPDGRLWYVADAGHTDALRSRPADYRVSVVSFLREATAGAGDRRARR